MPTARPSAIGLRRAVETVDDAVMRLGRAALDRWLSVQLMSASASRQASRVLEERALARGRILEAVARVRGDDKPGAHFALRLLSLIEQLLQAPMAAALGVQAELPAIVEEAWRWASDVREGTAG